MDAIRDESGAIERHERQSLSTKLAMAARAAERARQLYLFAIIGIAIIAFTIAYFIWQSSRDRHRALIDAISADQRQSAIFDSALNAIILINPSGSIEIMNPAAERLFGYPATDLLRRDIAIIADLAPGNGAFLDRIGLHADTLSEPFRPLVLARHANGGAVPVEVALGLMPLEDGVHIVAVFSDITEREKVEQIKDQFLSTVSHELRTPLTSIVGSLGLLNAGVGGELPTQARHLAEIAENNANRLIRIVNDILDAEKLQSGQMTFANVPLDLRDVIATAAEGMSGLAATKTIAIEKHGPDQALTVRGDSERLVQVVNNLISNAIKFSPAQSRIDISVVQLANQARVSIADQGPGIPLELRERLFSRFAQASGAPASGVSGTGLGLSIARDIVQHHGGTIGFSDSESGGTVFSFDLPLLVTTGHIEALKGPSRVLLYADPADANALRTDFANRSIQADVTETIADTISALKQRRYLALIVDFQFGRKDALALIHAVRAEPLARNLPIIGIASDGMPAADLGDAAAIDIIDWLDKPILSHQLDNAVATAIARAAVDMPLVLHVDDDSDTLKVTATALSGLARVAHASDLASARAFLDAQKADILIVDIALPDGSGLDLVTDLAGSDQAGTPVIVYSAQDGGSDLRDVEAVLTKSRKSLPNLVDAILAIRAKQGGAESFAEQGHGREGRGSE
jgi:PAS domain S-box-containing protein